MRDLKLTLLQSELVWQNPGANRDRFEALIGGLYPGTDLVVLPEMFNTGFSMQAAECAETMGGDTVAWMRRMAAARNMVVCGSLIIAEDQQYYNRLVWMPPDGQPTIYDKRHLFRMAHEDQHFAAGSRRVVVELAGWRICPLVCYDLRFPVWSRNRNDYDLAIYVANWPEPRRSAWVTLLKARAIENLCYVAGVNRVGVDGNSISYAGDSAIWDFIGQSQGDAEDRPKILSATLSMERLSRYRSKFPAHLDADDFSLDGIGL